MHLGSTYLIVKDMKKSLRFYESILEVKPASLNMNRWAEFHIGNSCIALFNPEYDVELIKKNENLEAHFNKEYMKYKETNKTIYGNNVVLNFGVSDLKSEYERIKNLNIGEVTEIFYINIVMPYFCFMIKDPDGNWLEITGNYNDGSK